MTLINRMEAMGFTPPQHPMHYFQMDSPNVIYYPEHSLLPCLEHQCFHEPLLRKYDPSELGSLSSPKSTSLNAEGKLANVSKEGPQKQKLVCPGPWHPTDPPGDLGSA